MKQINITAQLNAATKEGKLADANQIYDSQKGQFQEQVNKDLSNLLDNLKSVLEGLNNSTETSVSHLHETIHLEEQRAKNAEKEIKEELRTEEQRAKSEETVLHDRITNEVNLLQQKITKLENIITSKVTIETDVTPAGGGVVSGGGTYIIGTPVELTAKASNNYVFSRWSDGVTTPTRTVVAEEGLPIFIAEFEPKRCTIKIYANPVEGGKVSLESASGLTSGTFFGSGSFCIGESVILTPHPNPGYIFKCWSDGVTTPTRTIVAEPLISHLATYFAVAPYDYGSTLSQEELTNIVNEYL